MTEILSPVGNEDMLVAAVRSGADAVYLGLEDFNARRNAQNFTLPELKKSVQYCHVRGVKVYLTLNILLYENELDRALAVAKDSANVGIDGIICADIGLANMIHKKIPDMPLHASTQMTVHTADALPLLKELGFTRVVPSRELSKYELSEFCKVAKENDIEVEVFLHGALCMSMSGGCLMSAVFGGRSGNRGLCAGPCRLPFKSGKQEYALSLKDMSYMPFIKELEKMGVSSFKIEGRMKNAEYVAAATFAARNMLYGEKYDEDMYGILKGVFSRSGFTDGYYKGEYSSNMFGIRTDDDKEEFSAVSGKIHDIYRRERATVKLSAELFIEAERAARIVVSDGDNRIEAFGNIPQKATSDKDFVPLYEEKIKKLGNTHYYIEDVKFHVEEGLYLPLSDVTALRKAATDGMTLSRTKVKKYEVTDYSHSSEEISAKEQKFCAFFYNPDEIPESANKLDYIIIPAEKWQDKEYPTRVVLGMPRGLSDRSLLEKCMSNAKKSGLYVLAQNIATVNVLKQNNIPFIAGEFLNIMNTASCGVYKALGAKGITVSYETKLSDFKRIMPSTAIVYGKMPLMLTRVCPKKVNVGCDKNCYITDRKGIQFPLMCRGGYTEILNSRPTVLSNKLADFKKFDYLRLDFRNETAVEAEKIINAYIYREKISGEFTKGLYENGVL